MTVEQSRMPRVKEAGFHFALIVAVVLAAGCSQPSPKHAAAPNDFAPRIAGADRVVLTNRLAGLNRRYLGFSYAVSGRAAADIVEAVSVAPGHSPPFIDLLYDWDLQFWKGTNHLASVEYAGNVFRFDDREYVDKSGVLDSLSFELYRRTTPFRGPW